MQDINPINTPASLLTKREAAAHFKIAPRTLDNWMKKKMIPFLKIGKLVRFRIQDIEAALQKKFRR